jgi:hypothetical protein
MFPYPSYQILRGAFPAPKPAVVGPGLVTGARSALGIPLSSAERWSTEDKEALTRVFISQPPSVAHLHETCTWHVISGLANALLVGGVNVANINKPSNSWPTPVSVTCSTGNAGGFGSLMRTRAITETRIMLLCLRIDTAGHHCYCGKRCLCTCLVARAYTIVDLHKLE